MGPESELERSLPAQRGRGLTAGFSSVNSVLRHSRLNVSATSASVPDAWWPGGPAEVPAEAPAVFMEARPGGPGDSSSGSEEGAAVPRGPSRALALGPVGGSCRARSHSGCRTRDRVDTPEDVRCPSLGVPAGPGDRTHHATGSRVWRVTGLVVLRFLSGPATLRVPRRATPWA